MGSKPAEGLNTGILFLMAAPYAIIGFVGYRWYKSKQSGTSLATDIRQIFKSK